MAPTTLTEEVDNSVTFMSWNSTDFNQVKSQWLTNICDEKSVFFCSIQEHFKTENLSDKFFRDKFRQFNSYVIPGHCPAGQDSGRASGGLAQLSRKEIAVKKDRVLTKNYRVQAQMLNLPSSKLLWINTYFPTDPHI